jgi:hypothetical protein
MNLSLMNAAYPREHSSVNGPRDTDNILRALKNYSGCSDNVVNNLRIFTDNGDIVLKAPNLCVDLGHWNGELYITLIKPFTNERLINYIIAGSHAAEITMEGENCLRLWWN